DGSGEGFSVAGVGPLRRADNNYSTERVSADLSTAEVRFPSLISSSQPRYLIFRAADTNEASHFNRAAPGAFFGLAPERHRKPKHRRSRPKRTRRPDDPIVVRRDTLRKAAIGRR